MHMIDRVIHSTSDVFDDINDMSISVNWSNFYLVFFKGTCHANPGTEIK